MWDQAVYLVEILEKECRPGSDRIWCLVPELWADQVFSVDAKGLKDECSRRTHKLV